MVSGAPGALLVVGLQHGEKRLLRYFHAADLLHKLDPSRDDAAAIRPAPTRYDWSVYGSRDVQLPQYSTQLYIDTDKGEYAGALQLMFADFLTLSAIGLISTKNPDGSPGFSLLVVITADFLAKYGLRRVA